MKKSILFIFAILIIVSCSKKENVPNGIISPAKMASIIADIYNAEYTVQHAGIPTDSSKLMFRHYELKIFEDYGVNDSIYKNSFTYYLEHPEMLESVYDIVIDSLSLQDQLREVARKNSKEKN